MNNQEWRNGTGQESDLDLHKDSDRGSGTNFGNSGRATASLCGVHPMVGC